MIAKRPYLPLGLAIIAAALIANGGTTLATESVIRTEREIRITQIVAYKDRQIQQKDTQIRQKDVEVKVKEKQVQQAQAAAASVIAAAPKVLRVPTRAPVAVITPSTTDAPAPPATEPTSPSDEPAGSPTTPADPPPDPEPSPEPSPSEPGKPTPTLPGEPTPTLPPEPSQEPHPEPDSAPHPEPEPTEEEGIRVSITLGLGLLGLTTLMGSARLATSPDQLHRMGHVTRYWTYRKQARR